MTPTDIINLFLLSLLGGVVGLAGGIFFLLNKKWSNLLELYSIPFAAGVLLTVSLLGLIPEAVEANGKQAFFIVLISFLGTYFFEFIFFSLHHHSHDHHGLEKKSSVFLVVFGDTIHNFIDGVAIGASFLVSPWLAFSTAVSTFLHEIPHEISDFGILLKAGFPKQKVILVNVISAMATTLGAFLVVMLFKNQIFVGTLLAVSAGIFLYLGASDFLPQTGKVNGSRLKAVIPLFLGVLIMSLVLLLLPRS